MPTDEVPMGWREETLGRVATIVMGQAPPGITVTDWNADCQECDEGLPFVQGNAEFTSDYPLPSKWCSAPAKVAERGDTLISVRAPVGALNRANRRLAIGRGLAAIRFTGVEPRFGWHLLGWASRALARVAQGSTFDAINSIDLYRLAMPLPPARQQIEIASVLDSLDEAIGKTGAVIEATERLRKSLAQELLTRGMPGRHREWKQVPGIGAIPACWKVVRLGDCGKWLSGGTPSKKESSFWQGRIPWISPKDMKLRRISDSEDHVTPEAVMNGTTLAEPGCILIVVRGMILAHTVPVALLTRPAAFNQDIKALVCRADVHPEFLNHALNARSSDVLALVDEATHGTKRLPSEALFSVAIAIPSEGEQDQIASAIERCDDRLNSEEEVLRELNRAKWALADRLLSGQVRVGMLTEEESQESAVYLRPHDFSRSL